MTDDSPTSPPIVRLSGVTKSYVEGGGSKTVLENANLEIAEGELVVLLGRSGSGKSTLLNLLGGIDQPDEGSVEVAGQALERLTERERTLFRRRSLGFVFQFFNLVPTLTVRENLFLRLELNRLDDAAHRAEALALLDEVGLADRADTWPDRLSGGEQQRVAIASALVHAPRLILADEPTGNLDLESGQKIIEILDRLSRRAGRTLVMATHSREVMGIADRVLTIEAGALTSHAPDRAPA